MSLVCDKICIPRTSVILSSQEDENHAFLNSHESLQNRIEILQKADFNVVHAPNYKRFPKFAYYLKKKHPEGVFQQIWRGHGDDKSFVLSKMKQGIASVDSEASLQKSIRTICQSIQSGGYLITESCCNGKGPDNFLKYLATFCNAGVVLIGSRNQQFDIQFEPEIPFYCRYISKDGIDQTRIYFKSENGQIQNIDPQQLDLLWKFLESSKETFELCYKLIGESQNFPEYQRIRRQNQKLIESHLPSASDIKNKLLQTVVSSDHIFGFWNEMLSNVKVDLGISSNDTITVPKDARSCELIVTEDDAILINEMPIQSSSVRICQFLLGIAALQKHKTVFQLLEDHDNPKSKLFLLECIYALSGLTLHIDESTPIIEQLNKTIQTVKKSYFLAYKSGLSHKWLEILKWQNGSCLNAYITALNEFYEELLLIPPLESHAIPEDKIKDLKMAIISEYRKLGLNQKKIIQFIARYSINNIADLSDFIHQIVKKKILLSSDLIKIAIKLNCKKIIKMVPDYAYIINAPARNGHIPIFLAYLERNFDVLRCLLKLGANPNAQNEDGETLLHFALKDGEYEFMKVLINFGADPHIRNKLWRSPHELAQLNDDDDAYLILARHFV